MIDRKRDIRHSEIPGRRRPSALVRVFGSLIGWGLFMGLLAAVVVGWGYFKFTSAGPATQDRVVVIPQGSGRADIAALLQDQGVISDARVFSAAAVASQLRGQSMKPGEYSFPANTSMLQVMRLLNAGRVLTYKLTIPEGWTSEMALARIRENDVLEGDVTVTPPEGGLVANTIVFQRGRTRDEIITTMTQMQSKLVDELWAKRPADTLLKSKEEMVTLASIVEKETGVAEERPLVAAVFVNRLKKGMRLQSDPTIIYGLVGGKGKLDRGLTRADIDGKTPYNTYQVDGLPPGPIAIPGKASLEAVLSPASVGYLYFVADGTGAHAFATTLEEHNANVRKWRALEAQPSDPVTEVQPQTAVQPAPAEQQPAPATTPTGAEPQAPAAEPPPTPPLTATGLESVVPEEPAAVAAPPTAETEDSAEPIIELKPGSLVRVGERLIPVPAQRRLQ